MGSGQGQGEPDQASHVRFAEAVIALEDEQAMTIREPYDEEEDRWVTLGMDAFGRILTVVYTWRGEDIRLISARLATAHERRQYEKSDKA
jgi:uncharacterized DUF497 family protein